MSVAVKLTKPQIAELRRMAVRPQYSHGSSTARIQNNLVRMGLAQFIDDAGTPIPRAVTIIDILCPPPHDKCAITEAGRSLLKDHE